MSVKTAPRSAVVQSHCFCPGLSVAICFGIVGGRQINQKIKVEIVEEKWRETDNKWRRRK